MSAQFNSQYVSPGNQLRRVRPTERSIGKMSLRAVFTIRALVDCKSCSSARRPGVYECRRILHSDHDRIGC